jgi:hypothetical protein
LFGKAIQLIFLHAGNLTHLFELRVTGKFQCAADFLPGLPGIAGRFLTITCKLIPDHPFGMRLLFFKVCKKILGFNLAAKIRSKLVNPISAMMAFKSGI